MLVNVISPISLKTDAEVVGEDCGGDGEGKIRPPCIANTIITTWMRLPPNPTTVQRTFADLDIREDTA